MTDFGLTVAEGLVIVNRVTIRERISVAATY